MKFTTLRKLLLCGLLLAPAALIHYAAADDAKPKIYDAAIGAKQVDEAVALARKEHKRVLLQFGAEWCIWCHRMHDLFEADKDIAGELKSHYVVLLIDVDKGRNQDIVDRYGKPTRFGLPSLVVLDAEGKQLTTKDTNELEEGGNHHSPVKVMEFLREWAPK